MELDAIDAFALDVESLQDRRIAIGEARIIGYSLSADRCSIWASCSGCAAAPSRSTASCKASSVVNTLYSPSGGSLIGSHNVRYYARWNGQRSARYCIDTGAMLDSANMYSSACKSSVHPGSLLRLGSFALLRR